MGRSALKVFGLVLLGLWLGNSSLLWGEPGRTSLLAHRGVHQQFAQDGLTAESCTAAMLLPSGHAFLENTLPSMSAAFAVGAAVVELDIAETSDGRFAVFHDWTLDCRTDGMGEVRDHNMADLKTLDLGHGYTADGTTFPLRGKGLGLMPELGEVLDAMNPAALLVNFKTSDAAEGVALARFLRARGQGVWAVYGDAVPVRAAMAEMPGLRGFDRSGLQACLLRYLAIGWTGGVPAVCHETVLAVPLDLAPLLWGWPHLFTSRMRAAGSEVILMGPYLGGGGFSTGIDDASLAGKVPKGFDGLVWTNRIEVVAPLFQNSN